MNHLLSYFLATFGTRYLNLFDKIIPASVCVDFQQFFYYTTFSIEKELLMI